MAGFASIFANIFGRRRPARGEGRLGEQRNLGQTTTSAPTVGGPRVQAGLSGPNAPTLGSQATSLEGIRGDPEDFENPFDQAASDRRAGRTRGNTPFGSRSGTGSSGGVETKPGTGGRQIALNLGRTQRRDPDVAATGSGVGPVQTKPGTGVGSLGKPREIALNLGRTQRKPTSDVSPTGATADLSGLAAELGRTARESSIRRNEREQAGFSDVRRGTTQEAVLKRRKRELLAERGLSADALDALKGPTFSNAGNR